MTPSGVWEDHSQEPVAVRSQFSGSEARPTATYQHQQKE